jgi:hypothetical protein
MVPDFPPLAIVSFAKKAFITFDSSPEALRRHLIQLAGLSAEQQHYHDDD